MFGAYAMLVALLLLFFPPSKLPLSPISVGGAILGGLLCIYWSTYRLLPRGDLPPVHKFQTNFLTALAGAEFVMFSGTFIGSRPFGPLPFAIVAWALMFAFVLPKLILYWKRHDGTPF